MRFRAILLSLTLVVAACGAVGAVPTPSPTPAGSGIYPGWSTSAATDLIPVPVSTELVIGENRMLVNLGHSKDGADGRPGPPRRDAPLRACRGSGQAGIDRARNLPANN